MSKKMASILFFVIIILSLSILIVPKSYALPNEDEGLIGKVLEVGKPVDIDEVAMYFFFDNESNVPFSQYSNPRTQLCRSESLDTGEILNPIESCASNLEGKSKRWKIVSIQRWSFAPFYYMIPYEYKEPLYELSCNPEIISQGEYSNCTLKATYYTKLKNIDFNLNINDYEISDVKAGDDFEDLQVEDNKYSLRGKSSMEESSEGKETSIMTFRITSKTNKEVNLENNIKIENINYQDQVEEGSKEIVTATIKQKSLNNDNNTKIFKNPNTGDKVLIIMLLMIFSLGIGTFIYKRKA